MLLRLKCHLLIVAQWNIIWPSSGISYGRERGKCGFYTYSKEKNIFSRFQKHLTAQVKNWNRKRKPECLDTKVFKFTKYNV